MQILLHVHVHSVMMYIVSKANTILLAIFVTFVVDLAVKHPWKKCLRSTALQVPAWIESTKRWGRAVLTAQCYVTQLVQCTASNSNGFLSILYVICRNFLAKVTEKLSEVSVLHETETIVLLIPSFMLVAVKQSQAYIHRYESCGFP